MHLTAFLKELCYVYLLCVGYRADSHPIHYWIGYGPHLDGVYILSNGGWDMNWYGVSHKVSIKSISLFEIWLN